MSQNNEYNVMFASTINEGIKAARAISDAGKKAEVYASLALAIAQTGLVTGVATNVDAPQEDKPAKKETAKPKPDAKKDLKPQPDKTVDDKVEAVTAESRLKETAKNKTSDEAWTTEWNDATMEEFSDELDTLSEKMEEYGDDLNDVVAEWSDGRYSSPEQLNPLNIRAFLIYLTDLERSIAEDEAVAQ